MDNEPSGNTSTQPGSETPTTTSTTASSQPASTAGAGNPGHEPPISNEITVNWVRIILVGLYLLAVLLFGIFLMGSLMTVETDTDIVKCYKNIANANANANANNKNVPCPAPSPTATPAAAAATNSAPANTTAANSNANSNAASNQASAANSTANTTSNAAAAGTTSSPSPSPANPGVVNVVVPKEVYWSIPVFTSWAGVISADSYLFLLVLFAGMMGGAVRALYSYVKHLGLNDFSIKWLGYYFTLPFTGAALALIIYFVVRGGFGGASFGSGLPFNPFSFAALAALTGLFTENAMDKLKQVADTLLAPSTPKTTDAKQQMQEQAKNNNATGGQAKPPAGTSSAD